MDDKLKTICRVLGKGLLTGAALYLGWLADMYLAFRQSTLVLSAPWLVEFIIPVLTLFLCVLILNWKPFQEWNSCLLMGWLLSFFAGLFTLVVPRLQRIWMDSQEVGIADAFIYYGIAIVFLVVLVLLRIIMVVIQSRQKRKPALRGAETKEETPWMTN